jgi:hypothetical protein
MKDMMDTWLLSCGLNVANVLVTNAGEAARARGVY